MHLVPSEFEIAGTYVPPLLIAGTLGVIAMVLTASVMNRYRLSRFFVLPELVMLGMALFYTSIIGTFVIPT